MLVVRRIFRVGFSIYSALSIRGNRDGRVYLADCVSKSDDEIFTGIRSLSLSSPLAHRRCIATEGRAVSSRERLCHRALLSATRSAPPPQKRLGSREDAQSKKDGEWRTPTMTTAARRWPEEERGEGYFNRRPGCAASLYGILH